jgi:hypothetical protein
MTAVVATVQAFAGPTDGPVTGVIVSNFQDCGLSGAGRGSDPCTAATLTRAAPAAMPSSQLILRISHLCGHADSRRRAIARSASADHTSC